MNSSSRWQLSVMTPTGEQQGILELVVDGGSCSGRVCNEAGELALEDGAWDDQELSWNLRLHRPIPLTLACRAQITDATLSGDVTVAAFGNFSFTGRLLEEHSD